MLSLYVLITSIQKGIPDGIITVDDDDLEITITYVGPTPATPAVSGDDKNSDSVSEIAVRDQQISDLEKTLQNLIGFDEFKNRPKPTPSSSIKLSEFEPAKPQQVNRWLTVVRHSKVPSPTGSPNLLIKESPQFNPRQTAPSTFPVSVLKAHPRSPRSKKRHSTVDSPSSGAQSGGNIKATSALDNQMNTMNSSSTVSMDSCKIQPLRPSSLRDGSSVKPIALPIPDAVPKITIASSTLAGPSPPGIQPSTSTSPSLPVSELKEARKMPPLIPMNTVICGPQPSAPAQTPLRVTTPIVIRQSNVGRGSQSQVRNRNPNLISSARNRAPVLASKHSTSQATISDIPELTPVDPKQDEGIRKINNDAPLDSACRSVSESELRNQQLITTLGLIKSFGEIEIEKRIEVSNKVGSGVPNFGMAEIIAIGQQENNGNLTSFADLVKSVEMPSSNTPASSQVMTFYSSNSNDAAATASSGSVSPFVSGSSNSPSMRSSGSPPLQPQLDTSDKDSADYTASAYILNLAQIPLPGTPIQRVREMEIHPILTMPPPLLPETTCRPKTQKRTNARPRGQTGIPKELNSTPSVVVPKPGARSGSTPRRRSKNSKAVQTAPNVTQTIPIAAAPPQMSLPSFSSSFMNNAQGYAGNNTFVPLPLNLLPAKSPARPRASSKSSNWTPPPQTNVTEQQLVAKLSGINFQDFLGGSGWPANPPTVTTSTPTTSAVLIAPKPAHPDGEQLKPEGSVSISTGVASPKKRSYVRRNKAGSVTVTEGTIGQASTPDSTLGAGAIPNPKPRRKYVRKVKLDMDGHPIPPAPRTPRNKAPDAEGDGGTMPNPRKKPQRSRKVIQSTSESSSVCSWSASESERGDANFKSPIELQRLLLEGKKIEAGFNFQPQLQIPMTSGQTAIPCTASNPVPISPIALDQPIAENLKSPSPGMVPKAEVFSGKKMLEALQKPPTDKRFPQLSPAQPKRQRRKKEPGEEGYKPRRKNSNTSPNSGNVAEKSKRRESLTKTPVKTGVPYVPPPQRLTIQQKRNLELLKSKAIQAALTLDTGLANNFLHAPDQTISLLGSDRQPNFEGTEKANAVVPQTTTKTKLLQNITQTLTEGENKVAISNQSILNSPQKIEKSPMLELCNFNPSMTVTVREPDILTSSAATSGIMSTLPSPSTTEFSVYRGLGLGTDNAISVPSSSNWAPEIYKGEMLIKALSGEMSKPKIYEPSFTPTQERKIYPAHRRVAALVEVENGIVFSLDPSAKLGSERMFNSFEERNVWDNSSAEIRNSFSVPPPTETSSEFLSSSLTIERLLSPEAARLTLEDWKQGCSTSSETPMATGVEFSSTSELPEATKVEFSSISETPKATKVESIRKSKRESNDINPRASGRRVSRKVVKYAAPVPNSMKRPNAIDTPPMRDSTGSNVSEPRPRSQDLQYRVVENPGFRWTFTEDELAYLFQEGNFVMKRCDLSRDVESVPIWKVIDCGGPTLTLKQYSPYIKKNSNRVFHVSNYVEKVGEETQEYGAIRIVLEKHLREIFKNYLPVYVEKICHAPEISVVKLYRDDRYFTHMTFILKSEASLKEPYHSFVRTLICQAMDPRFLDKVINSDLKPENISIEANQMRNGWNQILSIIKCTCQEFMASPRWPVEIIMPFLKFPKLQYSAKNCSKDRNCSGCGDSVRPLHSPTKAASFDGIPYDQTNLMPNADANPEDESKPNPALQFCHACHYFMKSFHCLYHLPYHVLATIHFRLEMMPKEFPPDTKFDALSVKQALDADVDWFKWMFLDFLATLGQIKNNMEQMARCNYINLSDATATTNEM